MAEPHPPSQPMPTLADDSNLATSGAGCQVVASSSYIPGCEPHYILGSSQIPWRSEAGLPQSITVKLPSRKPGTGSLLRNVGWTTDEDACLKSVRVETSADGNTFGPWVRLNGTVDATQLHPIPAISSDVHYLKFVIESQHQGKDGRFTHQGVVLYRLYVGPSNGNSRVHTQRGPSVVQNVPKEQGRINVPKHVPSEMQHGESVRESLSPLRRPLEDASNTIHQSPERKVKAERVINKNKQSPMVQPSPAAKDVDVKEYPHQQLPKLTSEEPVKVDVMNLTAPAQPQVVTAMPVFTIFSDTPRRDGDEGVPMYGSASMPNLQSIQGQLSEMQDHISSIASERQNIFSTASHYQAPPSQQSVSNLPLQTSIQNSATSGLLTSTELEMHQMGSKVEACMNAIKRMDDKFATLAREMIGMKDRVERIEKDRSHDEEMIRNLRTTITKDMDELVSYRLRTYQQGRQAPSVEDLSVSVRQFLYRDIATLVETEVREAKLNTTPTEEDIYHGLRQRLIRDCSYDMESRVQEAVSKLKSPFPPPRSEEELLSIVKRQLHSEMCDIAKLEIREYFKEHSPSPAASDEDHVSLYHQLRPKILRDCNHLLETELKVLKPSENRDEELFDALKPRLLTECRDFLQSDMKLAVKDVLRNSEKFAEVVERAVQVRLNVFEQNLLSRAVEPKLAHFKDTIERLVQKEATESERRLLNFETDMTDDVLLPMVKEHVDRLDIKLRTELTKELDEVRALANGESIEGRVLESLKKETSRIRGTFDRLMQELLSKDLKALVNAYITERLPEVAELIRRSPSGQTVMASAPAYTTPVLNPTATEHQRTAPPPTESKDAVKYPQQHQQQPIATPNRTHADMISPKPTTRTNWRPATPEDVKAEVRELADKLQGKLAEKASKLDELMSEQQKDLTTRIAPKERDPLRSLSPNLIPAVEADHFSPMVRDTDGRMNEVEQRFSSYKDFFRHLNSHGLVQIQDDGSQRGRN